MVKTLCSHFRGHRFCLVGELRTHKPRDKKREREKEREEQTVQRQQMVGAGSKRAFVVCACVFVLRVHTCVPAG